MSRAAKRRYTNRRPLRLDPTRWATVRQLAAGHGVDRDRMQLLLEQLEQHGRAEHTTGTGSGVTLWRLVANRAGTPKTHKTHTETSQKSDITPNDQHTQNEPEPGFRTRERCAEVSAAARGGRS
jgi:hypothetical protein